QGISYGKRDPFGWVSSSAGRGTRQNAVYSGLRPIKVVLSRNGDFPLLRLPIVSRPVRLQVFVETGEVFPPPARPFPWSRGRQDGQVKVQKRQLQVVDVLLAAEVEVVGLDGVGEGADGPVAGTVIARALVGEEVIPPSAPREVE